MTALAALVTLLFYLATAHGYGYFRDELYYVACSARPAAGYVDFPPLLALVLGPWRAIAGESVTALRVLPAIAAAVTVALTGRLVRQLGGGRLATATALVPVMVAPIYVGTFAILTTNAFEVVLWTTTLLVFVRLLDAPTTRRWCALGVLLGVGFLTKHSMAFLAFALGTGLVLTPARRRLATAGPWIAASIALALALPHLAWQAANGWPTLEFLDNARRVKNLAQSPAAFVSEQVMVLVPFAAPIWIAGLVSLWRRDGGRLRPLVWAYAALLVLMTAAGGKAYYLTPFYPVLFAAGAVAFERSPRGRWIAPVLIVLTLATGIALAPIAKALLPEDTLIRWTRTLGLDPRLGVGERHELGLLPQQLADQHGWPELAAAVARAYHALPPADRARACIFAANYGEAGAIERFGPALGLPRPVSSHNTYWLWGPGACDFSVVVTVGVQPEDVRPFVGLVEVVESFRCRYCMPFEQRPILVTRGLAISRDELWQRLKRYI